MCTVGFASAVLFMHFAKAFGKVSQNDQKFEANELIN